MSSTHDKAFKSSSREVRIRVPTVSVSILVGVRKGTTGGLGFQASCSGWYRGHVLPIAEEGRGVVPSDRPEPVPVWRELLPPEGCCKQPHLRAHSKGIGTMEPTKGVN